MQWLCCVSAYFRGQSIFSVFSNIFRLTLESAYFRRSANVRGNAVDVSRYCGECAVSFKQYRTTKPELIG